MMPDSGETWSQPDGTDDEAADRESRDGDGHSHGENGDEIVIGRPEGALAREHGKAEAGGEMIECNQGEGAEAPEHEGVGESGERALANDFALQQDLPHKLADARPERLDMKVGIGARAADDGHDSAKSAPEQGDR